MPPCIYVTNKRIPMGLKHKPRHPIYFHSLIGWVEYAWEAILVCVIMAQFLNGINSMWFFTIGFLLTTIVMNAVFYLINMFYLGPYYKEAKAKLRLQDRCKDSPPKKDCTLTYNQMIANDLMYHNDERHFKIAFIAYTFLIVTYGIMLAFNGGQVTLQPLAAVPTADDIMAFVFVKGFQMMIMIAVGGLMFLCFDTHSCFMFTQATANNKALKSIIQGDLPVEREHHKRYTKDFDML